MTLGFECIRAQQAVRAKRPKIAGLRGPAGGVDFRDPIRFIVGAALSPMMTSISPISKPVGVTSKSRSISSRPLQLDREEFAVPAGVFGELVVGKDVGPLLRLTHILDADNRHALNAKQPRGLEPAVAGDNAVLGIDQDRVGPPEGADPIRNLADLFLE